jgi:hypothetical protein
MIATTHTTRIPTQGTPTLVRNATAGRLRRARWSSSYRPMR